MYRNRTASQHNFATLPLGDVPRSKFKMRQTRKQAFNASELIPIFCEEVLPGDTWQHHESIMARLATPIAPALDDLALETFYFFYPMRLAYPNFNPSLAIEHGWDAFISGRPNDGLPTIIPEPQAGPTWPVTVGMLADHFGIPTGAFTAAPQFTAAPFIGYFHIFNDWFRDQNLQLPWELNVVQSGVGPIDWTNFTRTAGAAWNGMPLRANKRPDYFTKSLPWPQKGADVTLPLGSTATVYTAPAALITTPQAAMRMHNTASGSPTGPGYMTTSTVSGFSTTDLDGGLVADNTTFPANLYADLSTATASTLNQIRLAATTQQLLEKDARGGSRYVEQLLVHFGVRSPDYRLQRPEYLGGSYTPVTVNPIAQTAAYDAEPGPVAAAVGNLGAEMHAASSARTFTYAATEHGYFIGLAVVRATPTYQQGLRRHWGSTRTTRLGYYFPVFANIGEQAVNTTEIYLPVSTVPANATWGYQERWAEYRYTPNEITGHLRSTSATPMDWWHYAENFGAEPALNEAFITDKTQETLARSLATSATQWSAQIIMDVLHESTVARLMPAYSVPGITRF